MTGELNLSRGFIQAGNAAVTRHRQGYSGGQRRTIELNEHGIIDLVTERCIDRVKISLVAVCCDLHSICEARCQIFYEFHETIVETYLANRGLALPPPQSLRFHPARKFASEYRSRPSIEPSFPWMALATLLSNPIRPALVELPAALYDWPGCARANGCLSPKGWKRRSTGGTVFAGSRHASGHTVALWFRGGAVLLQ